jgi:predicted transposase/invertase (TIGR01784 family)
MPNFKKTEDQLESKFDKWLFVLKNLHKLRDRPKNLQERVFEKFFRSAEIAQFTPGERVAYEDSLKYYRDLKNSFDTAREEGKAEGEAIGDAIGEARGEARVTMKVAETLILMRENNEKIAQVTGLSIEEINTLRKKKADQSQTVVGDMRIVDPRAIRLALNQTDYLMIYTNDFLW